MTTYSVDGTLIIPFNILQKAPNLQDLMSNLLHECDIETVSIKTKNGDSYILNHYDYIDIEYKEKNIHEI
ncbi:hypothetical protein BC351_00775 [Paenibacillus ferrarius]|uniref:Uncharacterized protein n=1 Tax=Paenibacillus ferrarius TaxID=1469647 RepID=A0A1V4HSE7_9BACL|nr:hypothetical protein BC351_00775 [Paenibacillus ferrarius]